MLSFLCAELLIAFFHPEKTTALNNYQKQIRVALSLMFLRFQPSELVCHHDLC